MWEQGATFNGLSEQGDSLAGKMSSLGRENPEVRSEVDLWMQGLEKFVEQATDRVIDIWANYMRGRLYLAAGWGEEALENFADALLQCYTEREWDVLLQIVNNLNEAGLFEELAAQFSARIEYAFDPDPEFQKLSASGTLLAKTMSTLGQENLVARLLVDFWMDKLRRFVEQSIDSDMDIWAKCMSGRLYLNAGWSEEAMENYGEAFYQCFSERKWDVLLQIMDNLSEAGGSE